MYDTAIPVMWTGSHPGQARRLAIRPTTPAPKERMLAYERDRHRVGVAAWHATQRAAWEALVANSVAIAIKAARASAAAAGRFTR